MQQPPLSQQIRALEKHLGVTLLVLRPKGVRLTVAGTMLLSDAQRILGSVVALEERMARVARGLLGVLSVGFTSSAAAHGRTSEWLFECFGTSTRQPRTVRRSACPLRLQLCRAAVCKEVHHAACRCSSR